MDELLAKHRKEQRDLQSVVTQKKKSASKKTRKGVNEECIRLEQELKARQDQEVAALNGGDEESIDSEDNEADKEVDDLKINDEDKSTNHATESISTLSISSPASPTASQLEQAQRKPNRQKARLARRAAEQAEVAAKAAEDASNLPDLKAREREGMLKAFKKHGLKEKEVRADGHCLYAAVADQLALQDINLTPRITAKILADKEKLEPYRAVRRTAAQYIKEHEDDFSAFLEESLDEYVRKVGETGEWGGELELLALAKAYGVRISVLEGDGRVHAIEGDETTSKDEDKRVWLAYYRHGFGLGEHYNSLRKG